MLLIMVAASVPGLADSTPSQAWVAQIILSFQEEYPDGSLWSGEASYAWKGGIDDNGSGDRTFLFMVSDAAFGSLPARVLEPVAFDSLQPGDILLTQRNNHSVLIIDILEDHVTVVEESVDRHGDTRVYWGRTLSKESVEEGISVLTRYPEEKALPGAVPGDVNADGTVDGRDVLRLSRFIVGQEVEVSAWAADVNGDGKVDGRDLLRLARYMAGQDGE